MSISLSVVISAPVDYDASFQLQAEDPSYVAAGNKSQGFLPVVIIPAGQTTSNAFALYGINVGFTSLDIIPLSPGFSSSSVPAGAWDVNQSGSAQKFVDANPASATCRDNDSPDISTNGSLLATCGASVNGVASDGATKLLLRTLAGLPGTACYEITSASPELDQGNISTGIASSEPVDDLNYAFSLYTAPGNYGDNSASRTVTVTFTFTPSIGNGNTTSFTSDVTILRPPVVLVHGLWSDASAWSADFARNDTSHTTVKANYKSTNASHFSVNVLEVQKAINNAFDQFRTSQNAVTQVDVIGHSMGGILTRLYANGPNNRRPNNFGLGDVHRLITLDTPHWGSTLANLLVSLHTVAPKRVDTIGVFGKSVTGGAVCDLAENSPALKALAETPLGGSALNASGGTFPAYESRIETVLTKDFCTGYSFTIPPHCTSHINLFPQDRVDAFRFQAANDQIVGLTDQEGGIGGQNFPTLIHTNVNTMAEVATASFTLLDGPDNKLSGSFFPAAQSTGLGNPAAPPRGVKGLGATQDQADYKSQCGAGGSMNPAAVHSVAQTPLKTSATPLVTITSPAAGQVFTPGEKIAVIVQLDPSLGATDVVLGMPPIPLVSTTIVDSRHFQASVAIPGDFAGPLTITPVALDPRQNETQGPSIIVNVKSPSAPSSVSFAQKYFFVDPSDTSEELSLSATYADGSKIDVTSAAAGTTYTSNNTAVAKVSADGVVTIVGSGTAVVTGSNQSQKDFAIFLVERASSPLPPQNLTSQFSVKQGGYRLDRNTGFFVQTVVVTNNSELPVPGSAYLIFSGLPKGVVLVNKTGITKMVTPGSSYLTIPPSSDGRTIAPGQTNTFVLQFLNPNRSAITYTPTIYRETLAP